MMNSLKKIALVSAIAAAPFAAQAELAALDDASMGDVTGQAGVTIDLSANVSVGEIAYQDQGFLVIDGLTLGGHSELVAGGAPDALDNLRLTIDVAGSLGDDLGASSFGAAYLASEGFTTEVNEQSQNISDGDLVISLRSQSDEPVDFGLFIESVSLAKQEGNSGNIGNLKATNTGTVLSQDLRMDGYIGPVDIVVQEESNSMNINAYFSASGSVTVPYRGTSMSFELHNRRGATVMNADGMSFAHAQVDVSVAEGYFDDGGDALAVNVQDLSGDLDMTDIKMGNGISIGALYLTDLSVTAETVIYGH
ncbi:DUF6160 family protein [Hydrocarboniclastica marina]|nr:DUF6160 family protein [Hydrocarboniclastica marina]